jgi:hypothetical protein
MNQIMKFAEATTQATGKNDATTEGESVAPEVVEQLRHRLIHNPGSDSVEMRVVIVGELVYQCYKQLAKKRYL